MIFSRENFVSFEQNEISYPQMQCLFRAKFSFSICLRSCYISWEMFT